jgi:sarcosine oxidase subunit beta
VLGATFQQRGGIARHENVAWGFARAADALGVDLLQGCEVTGIDVRDGRVAGVETSRGRIGAGTVALVAAGHSSVLAELAGFELPIQSHPLQALVSEIYEQVLDTVVMSNAVHVYVSQAHKGELVMGAGVDAYNSYAQRGSVHVIERQLAAAVELFPIFGGARVLRTWAGIVDVCPDASPIVGLSPVEGLYLNCGWGTGGFKATPGSGWALAWTIAHGEPHELNAPFALERFTTGALIDEHGAAGVAH